MQIFMGYYYTTGFISKCRMTLLLLKFEGSAGDAVEHTVALAASCFVSCCALQHTHTGAHIHKAQQVPAVMWDCMLQDADWNLCLCLLVYMSLCAWSRIRHSRMHPDHHIKTIMRRKVNIVLCHAPLTTAESIIVFIFKQLYLIKWNRPGTSITIMPLNINLGH